MSYKIKKTYFILTVACILNLFLGEMGVFASGTERIDMRRIAEALGVGGCASALSADGTTDPQAVASELGRRMDDAIKRSNLIFSFAWKQIADGRLEKLPDFLFNAVTGPLIRTGQYENQIDSIVIAQLKPLQEELERLRSAWETAQLLARSIDGPTGEKSNKRIRKLLLVIGLEWKKEYEKFKDLLRSLSVQEKSQQIPQASPDPGDVEEKKPKISVKQADAIKVFLFNFFMYVPSWNCLYKDLFELVETLFPEFMISIEERRTYQPPVGPGVSILIRPKTTR